MPTGHYIRKRIPLAIRFAKKCLPPNENGCILWAHRINNMGYGMIHSGKNIQGVPGSMMLAHRAAWEIANRQEIPLGMCVLHRCDTPRCVNPEHLILGTQAENMRDMADKNRCQRGEKRPQAKLKEADIREIRRLNSCGVQQPEIARQFHIAQPTVSKIVLRQRWNHIY